MIRWLMIALLVVGLAMAFVTRSPGVLGLGLLFAVVGAFGTVLAIASERISARARPDSAMLQADVIAAMQARAKARSDAGGPAPRADADNDPQA